MVRAWDLLKGKRARDVTGLQVAGVGGTTYIQPTNQTELRAWRDVSANAQNLAFKQGPWPSSLVMGSAELNGATSTLKPSTLYSSEDGATGYLCQLVAVSMSAASGNSYVTINLADGSDICTIDALANGSTKPESFLPTIPVYFNEDVYVTLTEGLSNACDVQFVVQVISYGGNPE
jgi:hypothetical protein